MLNWFSKFFFFSIFSILRSPCLFTWFFKFQFFKNLKIRVTFDFIEKQFHYMSSIKPISRKKMQYRKGFIRKGVKSPCTLEILSSSVLQVWFCRFWYPNLKSANWKKISKVDYLKKSCILSIFAKELHKAVDMNAYIPTNVLLPECYSTYLLTLLLV